MFQSSAHQQCVLTGADGEAAPQPVSRFTRRLTSPRAPRVCVPAGSREGSSALQAHVHLPMPSCRGRWDALPLCTASTGKPNASWLWAACRETNGSVSSSVSIATGLFGDSCSNSRRVFCRRRSTNHICLAVLRETAQAEGLCFYHRNCASWAPVHHTDAWKSVSLTTHIYTVLLQGLYLLQQS